MPTIGDLLGGRQALEEMAVEAAGETLEGYAHNLTREGIRGSEFVKRVLKRLPVLQYRAVAHSVGASLASLIRQAAEQAGGLDPTTARILGNSLSHLLSAAGDAVADSGVWEDRVEEAVQAASSQKFIHISGLAGLHPAKTEDGSLIIHQGYPIPLCQAARMYLDERIGEQAERSNDDRFPVRWTPHDVDDVQLFDTCPHCEGVPPITPEPATTIAHNEQDEEWYEAVGPEGRAVVAAFVRTSGFARRLFGEELDQLDTRYKERAYHDIVMKGLKSVSPMQFREMATGIVPHIVETDDPADVSNGTLPMAQFITVFNMIDQLGHADIRVQDDVQARTQAWISGALRGDKTPLIPAGAKKIVKYYLYALGTGVALFLIGSFFTFLPEELAMSLVLFGGIVTMLLVWLPRTGADAIDFLVDFIRDNNFVDRIRESLKAPAMLVGALTLLMCFMIGLGADFFPRVLLFVLVCLVEPFVLKLSEIAGFDVYDGHVRAGRRTMRTLEVLMFVFAFAYAIWHAIPQNETAFEPQSLSTEQVVVSHDPDLGPDEQVVVSTPEGYFLAADVFGERYYPGKNLHQRRRALRQAIEDLPNDESVSSAELAEIEREFVQVKALKKRVKQASERTIPANVDPTMPGYIVEQNDGKELFFRKAPWHPLVFWGPTEYASLEAIGDALATPQDPWWQTLDLKTMFHPKGDPWNPGRLLFAFCLVVLLIGVDWFAKKRGFDDTSGTTVMWVVGSAVLAIVFALPILYTVL